MNGTLEKKGYYRKYVRNVNRHTGTREEYDPHTCRKYKRRYKMTLGTVGKRNRSMKRREASKIRFKEILLKNKTMRSPNQQFQALLRASSI